MNRKNPLIVVSCPICDSSFMASVIISDGIIDDEHNEELLNELSHYAKNGCNVSFKDAGSFQMESCKCEYMKGVPHK